MRKRSFLHPIIPCHFLFVPQVYFLWICPSHKHFEWFIDVLRDVERKDVTDVLEIHIFITQFFHKFDLRTTMLVSEVILECLYDPRWTKKHSKLLLHLIKLTVYINNILSHICSTYVRITFRGCRRRVYLPDWRPSTISVGRTWHRFWNLFRRSIAMCVHNINF